jgi:protein phosphatase
VLRVVDFHAGTDTGRQRSANEDSYFARAPVFVVADGMGGAQAGEVASRVATDAFEAGNEAGQPPEAYLRSVAESANRRIHDLAGEDSSRSGMGTTLTAAFVSDEEISLAHVGDSRAYLFRDGELRRLTSDHSLVEELRRQGRLTEEEAVEHPQRSIITRALGPEATVEVDTMTYPARPGDVFLLCSDGLTTMLPDASIADVLRAKPDLRQAVRELIRGANEEGGRDNITAVAFRIEDAAAPAARREPEPAEGATLIGPSAEEEGLTAEAVREGARAAAAGSGPRSPDRRRGEAPPRRAAAPVRRWPGRLAKALAALLILTALVAAAVLGARQLHFLGTDEGGRIALYRGLPYELPFGAELYSEVYSSPTQVASLPEDRQDEATDHELRSRDDAEDLITDLENSAEPPAGSSGDSSAGGRRGGPPADARRPKAEDAAGGGAGQDPRSQRSVNQP